MGGRPVVSQDLLPHLKQGDCRCQHTRWGGHLRGEACQEGREEEADAPQPPCPPRFLHGGLTFWKEQSCFAFLPCLGTSLLFS